MSNCRICDSPLLDGTTACVVCGTSSKRKPTSEASAKRVDQTHASALELAGLEEAKGTDVSVARRLLRAAETARTENKNGAALEYAAAAKRAVEIAQKKGRLAARLSETQLRIEQARVAGIDTLSFEKALVDATKALERVDLATAERLLRRTSLKKEQAQQHKRVEALLHRAKKMVEHSRERGADPADALEEIKRAEEALRAEDFAGVKERCLRAEEKAEQARKYAWAEGLLKRAMVETSEAGRHGANVDVPRKHIQDAREALRGGVYAEVHRLSHEARRAAKEALRYATAERSIIQFEREVKKEQEKGADISLVAPVIEAARKDLGEGHYHRVRSHMKDARHHLKEAVSLRKTGESLQSLKVEVDELKAIGADGKEAESLLREAEAAHQNRQPDDVRRLITDARTAAEYSKQAMQKQAVAKAVEIIVSKAGAGRLDASRVKELLREVEEAALLGRAVDVGKIVEAELQLPDEERLKRAVSRLVGIRDMLVELRKTDVDVSDADEIIAKVRKQLDAGKFEDAELLIKQLEDLTSGLKKSLDAATRDLLDKSRQAVEATEAKGIPQPEARRFLENAEESFRQGKIYEALEFARQAHSRAEKALAAKEAGLAAEQVAALKISAEKMKELQRRLWDLQAKGEELSKADMDASKIREGVASVVAALDAGKLAEAEAGLRDTERLADQIWLALRTKAEKALDQAKASVAKAKGEEVHVPSLDETIGRGEQALNDGKFGEALLVAANIEQVIAASRAAQDNERGKQQAERGKRASKRYAHVRQLVNDLRTANIDIADSDDVLEKASRALQEKRFDDVDALLQELEGTANELKAQLVVAAKEIISKAEGSLTSAGSRKIDTGEARSILDTAKESLNAGKIDKAIEYASLAHKKADDAIKLYDEQQAAVRAKEEELARSTIARLKKMTSDLSRADIDVMGSSEAIAEAEKAFSEGRFADVPKGLEEIESLAQTLQEGLKLAAEDLLARSRTGVADAKKEGLDLSRGDKVLSNADEALRDGRYVETIEYTKVINDIVETAKRHKGIREIELTLKKLQDEVQRAESLGIDMSTSAKMLKEAQEDIALGRFDNLEEAAKKVATSVDSAQKLYIHARVKAMATAIQEGKDIGLETTAAEALYRKAENAIQRKDLEAIDGFAKQVDVLLVSTRRAVEAEQVEKDVRSLEDMLAQAARVGIEVGDLRPMALQAREALAIRDFTKAESIVSEGKSKVRERRRKQFADRYETKMQTISTMIGAAKQLGANVAEAERILAEASKALDKQDLNMADILVKQAEVSAGIQVQNFIKNRYPNLVVKLPEEGLQADVWNNYMVEVSNKGKLNARNVQLKLDGDVEVNGLKPIAELGINETKRLEFGVKPKIEGQVPLNVEILYQRFFDENKYELSDLKQLRVEKPGTYLVEDVFLVHSDGRLICHQSRKFREAIDEDIFSGMLTVIQDFVRDSFKQRSKAGLKRVDFGGSKILLERSEHAYAACVIVGTEPDLLPLYMAEVLREIEEKFGRQLEAWTGMMQELSGIEGYVSKLIFVTDAKGASLGALESSPVTETIRLLSGSSILDQDASEINEILAEAKEQVLVDPETAIRAINRAKEQASEAVEKFRSRMMELRDTTHRRVEEMKELGMDTSQAELLLKEADEAYQVGKFEKLQDIFSKLDTGLERARDSQVVKRIQSDLTNLIQDIQNAKAEGADTSMAESYLSRIQDALEEKNYRLVEDFFGKARQSLEDERKDALFKRCKESLDHLTSVVVEAKGLGVGLEEAEGLLMKAAGALQEERGQELEATLEAAKSSATQRIQEHLRDRYPRLFLSMPAGGLHSETWNNYVISVANRGNWPAKDVEVRIFGDVEMSGPRRIPLIGPNEKKTLEIGVKPPGEGAVPIDLQLFYHRPLDESRYELTESKEVRVESRGTYAVEDVYLVHKDGRLIMSESRTFREALSGERSARMLKNLQKFIGETYVEKNEIGLKRTGFETNTMLIEQGMNVRLAAFLSGGEPKVLPLYMTEVLKNVEDKYSGLLSTWNGDVLSLDGIQDMVRSLFFVSERLDVDFGPLSASPITAAVKSGKGTIRMKGEADFTDTARSVIETQDFPAALEVLRQIQEAVSKPAEELTAEVKAAVIATKETIGLELTDEEISAYVDVLRQVLQAVQRAKQKAGIEAYWPIKRVAVKPSSQLGLDAVTSFRKIIVNQSLAKELDIVKPDETWRGMRIRVQVDTDALNRAYKLWAKKIEILLKGQDAWKIKSGLDKGEYAVGIEGQRVKIDKEMVWFEESLPETVVEEPYEGGAVYLDSEMSEDILSEGYAKEIVRIIRDARKEMKLVEEQGVQLQIMASKGLYKMLKNWREYISSQTNSTDLRFIDKAPTEGYIIEATLGEENLSVAVRSGEV